MGVESTNYISGLTADWPNRGEPINDGDDHIRLIKNVLKKTFPGSSGTGFNTPIVATEAEINRLAGVTSPIQAQINSATTNIALKANIANPIFTGVPQAPTAAAGTNSNQLATTAFVAALGALKANIASPAFTGTPTVPTPAVTANTTQAINSAWAKTGVTAGFAQNGHIALPGFMAGGFSLILNWTKVTGASGSGSGSWTFPKAFTGGVFGVFFGEKDTALSGGMSSSIGYTAVTLTQVTYSKPSARDEFYIFAIGY